MCPLTFKFYSVCLLLILCEEEEKKKNRVRQDMQSEIQNPHSWVLRHFAPALPPAYRRINTPALPPA